MARRKVSVKNLRVGTQRIPDGIFRAIAAELLPGDDPTANQLKNGTPSKAMVLAGLCAVDPEWRRKTKAAAVVKMAAPLKQSAADAGWIAPSESSNAIAAYRSLWEALERDEIARCGRSTLTRVLNGQETESKLAQQLSGRVPLPPENWLADLAATMEERGKPRPLV